jgi:hypothetical protein
VVCMYVTPHTRKPPKTQVYLDTAIARETPTPQENVGWVESECMGPCTNNFSHFLHFAQITNIPFLVQHLHNKGIKTCFI